MKKINKIDALYAEYAAARRESNAAEIQGEAGAEKKSVADAQMQQLVGQIYEQATYMAASRWGNEEQQHFTLPSQRLIHEENWNNLYRIVTASLRLFKPERGVLFATYLMDAIKKQYARSAIHISRGKRAGRQGESSLPEDFELATGDATEFLAEDNELIERIKAELRKIHRTNMKFYLAYHVDKKTLKEAGEEIGGVTRERARQRIAKVKDRIGDLLWSLYDDCIDDHVKTVHKDEQAFGRCMQAALQQLAEEYRDKDAAGTSPADTSHAETVRSGLPSGTSPIR